MYFFIKNLNDRIQENLQNFGFWWKENIKKNLADISIGWSLIPDSIHQLKSTLLGIWCMDEKDSCDISICSLGHCVKEVDDAVRSAEITVHKMNPASKGVKVSPPLFKKYFGLIV